MSHCTWATSPSSLVLTASCTAGVCTFTGQPGYCSFGGAVTMTLTAPFDVAVEITASGGSGAGGASGASGATYGLVVVDDAVAGAASGDKEPVASAPFFVAVGTDVASPGDSEANRDSEVSLDESASVGFF